MKDYKIVVPAVWGSKKIVIIDGQFVTWNKYRIKKINPILKKLK